MAIKDILRKLVQGGNRDIDGEFSARDGMTSDEKELESYKRREYLANVKKELKTYREKDRNLLWKGSKMGDKHEIIKAPNVFKDSKKIFNVKKKARR